MLVRIPFRLRRQPDGSAFTDAEIRAVFIDLGYRARLRGEASDAAPEPGASSEYRDRATRNLNADMRDTTRAEVAGYCIFYGASSQTRSELFVNRVNDGEIVVWIHQARLEALLAFCERLCRDLATAGRNVLVLPGRQGSEIVPIELYPDKSAALIAEGAFRRDGWRSALEHRGVELIAFLLTALLALGAYGLQKIPVSVERTDDRILRIDPVGATLRGLAEQSWPTLAITSLILLVTLCAAALVASRKVARWRWY